MDLMEECINISRESGLENISWSGHTGIPGTVLSSVKIINKKNCSWPAKLASAYAKYGGCTSEIRNCTACSNKNDCKVKRYIPTRIT
jgi:hypothetical protein